MPARLCRGAQSKPPARACAIPNLPGGSTCTNSPVSPWFTLAHRASGVPRLMGATRYLPGLTRCVLEMWSGHACNKRTAGMAGGISSGVRPVQTGVSSGMGWDGREPIPVVGLG
jgi:hypothetical protein